MPTKLQLRTTRVVCTDYPHGSTRSMRLHYHRSVIGACSSKQCKSGGISVSMHSLAAGAGLIEARVARIRVALRARLRLWHARRGPACGALRRCGLRARRRLVRAFVGLRVDLRHVHATRLTCLFRKATRLVDQRGVHGGSGRGRAQGMVWRGYRPPPRYLGGTFLKKGAFFRMSGSTMSRTCEPRKKTLRHMRHCHQRVEGMSDHGAGAGGGLRALTRHLRHLAGIS